MEENTEETMRFIVTAITIGLVLIMSGCGQEYPYSTEPEWNACNSWKICDIPDRNIYNVTGSDCMTLQAKDAELLWGWLRKYDTTLTAECQDLPDLY